MSVSLQNIDFCFDTTQVKQNENDQIMGFRTQTVAVRHILLKIILLVWPNIVQQWMKHTGNRPIVLQENIRYGKKMHKVEFHDKEKHHHSHGLYGWFVIYVNKKKIVATDTSILKFNEKGYSYVEVGDKKIIYTFDR